ncbi:sensor histidine kinase [Actinokineospora sp.]|uniref:sensor histidine kinase n=1 Tax=Actinokineospora sp. TaxID=1872133 RepID=UPI0040378DD1
MSSVPVSHREERPLVEQGVLAPLAAVVVAGGVWVWVTVETPSESRALVGVFGALLVVLLGVALAMAGHRAGVAARRADEVELMRDEVESMRDEVDARAAELAVLARQTLPTAVRQLRHGASADTVLAEAPAQASDLHEHILQLLTREISVGERQRAAAMAACANAASRVQALATSTLADLREMENRHSEEVLGDLLKLDHATAQTGRLADSIAVLSGARSGRRWTKPIVMESILRGAMGRINAYQRIRLHSTSAAAVAGYAAEDVMHALAELMDNATRFSAPSEDVHIYVEELHAGVVITIEDGGLGMKPAALQRAERAVSPAEPLDLATLSGTRLGLAVVGCLARKHELHVFFRPSSRGGVGVVIRIPHRLITQVRQDSWVAPRAVLTGSASAAGDNGAQSLSGVLTGSVSDTGSLALAELPEEPAPDDSGSLPKRHRGHTLAATLPSPPAVAPLTPSPRPRAAAGARFGAFRAAARTEQPDPVLDADVVPEEAGETKDDSGR